MMSSVAGFAPWIGRGCAALFDACGWRLFVEKASAKLKRLLALEMPPLRVCLIAVEFDRIPIDHRPGIDIVSGLEQTDRNRSRPLKDLPGHGGESPPLGQIALVHDKIEAIAAQRAAGNNTDATEEKGNVTLGQIVGATNQPTHVAIFLNLVNQALGVRQYPTVVVNQHCYTPRLLPTTLGHKTSPNCRRLDRR